jgi:dUTP pyrophosphatase
MSKRNDDTSPQFNDPPSETTLDEIGDFIDGQLRAKTEPIPAPSPSADARPRIEATNDFPQGEKRPEDNAAKKIQKNEVKELTIIVKKRVPSEIPIPTKPSENISCYDLYADLAGTSFGNNLHIPAGQSRLIPTNLIFDISPAGYELQVRPKTGYVNDGLLIQYTAYIFDADSKEELKICAINTSKNDIVITHGQKIAQFVVARVSKSILVEAK